MKYIGVSACFFYPDLGRKVFGAKTLTYLEKDMSVYLARENVMPILIPDLRANELKAFLNKLDGLVLQGGDDVAPQSYGAVPIEDNRWPGDRFRDEYELNIIDNFIKHNKPVYGICRGFQLLNVYFGGTLLQDIATQKPEAQVHRDAIVYDQLHHDVSLMEGGYLQQLYGTNLGTVNTVHHQAVDTVGKGLDVTARSIPDDIVEGFTWSGAEAGKVFGVQWHPEFQYNFKGDKTLLDPHKLYQNFIAFC